MPTPARHVLTFRYVAYPGDNNGQPGFYAESIDADLLVWRPTLAEAVEEMKEAIQGFIEAMAELSADHDEFHELIRRSAPRPRRTKYYWYSLRGLVPGMWERATTQGGNYKIPAPEPDFAQAH